MSFDVASLNDAIARHGDVTRVVIADIKGSSPREVGASMMVWPGGQCGTIGGGALEYEMSRRARAGHVGLTQHALGPELGQCCGGAVQILTERFRHPVSQDDGALFARPVNDGQMQSLAVRRALAKARGGQCPGGARLLDGWFIEPVAPPRRALWIWGAGHVGRAMVDVFSPLPDFATTWVDTSPERYPETIANGVTALPAAKPEQLVRHAPHDAEHLIVTYSHALDLELCHRLLTHGFAFAGLIGSKSKWARFRNRLVQLGHAPHSLHRITCPIGAPEMGKHPQAIAISAAASLLRRQNTMLEQQGCSA